MKRKAMKENDGKEEEELQRREGMINGKRSDNTKEQIEERRMITRQRRHIVDNG